MRLIDADALGICKCKEEAFENKGYAKGWNSAIEIIEQAPTVDAVEVVRCKNCVHYREEDRCQYAHCAHDGMQRGQDDFCSYGMRRKA